MDQEQKNNWVSEETWGEELPNFGKRDDLETFLKLRDNSTSYEEMAASYFNVRVDEEQDKLLDKILETPARDKSKGLVSQLIDLRVDQLSEKYPLIKEINQKLSNYKEMIVQSYDLIMDKFYADEYNTIKQKDLVLLTVIDTAIDTAIVTATEASRAEIWKEMVRANSMIDAFFEDRKSRGMFENFMVLKPFEMYNIELSADDYVRDSLDNVIEKIRHVETKIKEEEAKRERQEKGEEERRKEKEQLLRLTKLAKLEKFDGLEEERVGKLEEIEEAKIVELDILERLERIELLEGLTGLEGKDRVQKVAPFYNEADSLDNPVSPEHKKGLARLELLDELKLAAQVEGFDELDEFDISKGGIDWDLLPELEKLERLEKENAKKLGLLDRLERLERVKRLARKARPLGFIKKGW